MTVYFAWTTIFTAFASQYYCTLISCPDYVILLLLCTDLGHRDQETGAGTADTEPLGQGSRCLREVPLLRLLPGHQGGGVFLSLSFLLPFPQGALSSLSIFSLPSLAAIWQLEGLLLCMSSFLSASY